MRCVVILVLVMLSIGSVASAERYGTIGIYRSPTPEDHCDLAPCVSAFPLYAPTNLYVLARPGFALDHKITGAEFRIVGFPRGLAFETVTASPQSNVWLGAIFADHGTPSGTNIAFPTCQVADENGYVLLFSIQVYNVGVHHPIELEVQQRDPPTNPNASFPLLTTCDFPVFTAWEVWGHSLVLDPNAVVAVESRSLSQVKQLYR